MSSIAKTRGNSTDCNGSNGRHRILILCGGFAAICAAQRLERTLACDANVGMQFARE
jgi:hypothetical protein